jgi:arylformamidase
MPLKGKAVLINTNWSLHWRTDKYFENHPFLTEEAANYLRDQKVGLVGIDSHNIDDTRTKRRPAHTILLKAGILICEHLCNLNKLPESFIFNAVPPKFKGVGTFPVRAYAEIPNA